MNLSCSAGQARATCVYSVCVCIRPHTYILHVGYSDVSPGVGTRHLKGPKNPDKLNLGIYVFIHVYKVHMCIYMLGGGMHVCHDSSICDSL